MKSVLLGCLIAVLLAFGASQMLEVWQVPAATAYSTEGVRLTTEGGIMPLAQ